MSLMVFSADSYSGVPLGEDRRMRIMKAKVDRSGCIGCGLCAEICPEVFRMADDGLSEVCGEASGDNGAAAAEAAEVCPVSVIALE